MGNEVEIGAVDIGIQYVLRLLLRVRGCLAGDGARQ
jgi:hypothetical protein